MAAHQEDVAKLPLKAQTGWSFWTDHPVRAFQRLPSAISLDGTATPPVPGGDYLRLDSNSFTPSVTAATVSLENIFQSELHNSRFSGREHLAKSIAIQISRLIVHVEAVRHIEGFRTKLDPLAFTQLETS